MKLAAGNNIFLLLGYLIFAAATLATEAKKSNPSPLPPPTNPPTFVPNKKPTAKPSKPPTPVPTNKPTPQPSKSPAYVPTKKPTVQPSKPPTFVPTKKPTAQPSKPPTFVPTQRPTLQPSKPPIFAPSNKPTLHQPSKPPTLAPTLPPTPPPSRPPTLAPTIKPTTSPPTTAPHGGAVFVQLTPPSLAPFPPPSFAPVVPPTFAPVVPPTFAPVVPPTFAPVVTVAPVVPPTFAPVPPPTFPPLLTNAPTLPLNTNNDNCYTAQAIPSAVTTITPFETASLTLPGAQYNACDGTNGTYPSKWFTYVAPGGCISLSASSLVYPAVYEGTCDSTTCISGVTYHGASIAWTPKANTAYIFAVFAPPNYGDFTLNITCELPTSNDSCQTALPALEAITLFETASLGVPPNDDQLRPVKNAKWYTFVSPFILGGTVLASTTGYGIHVYEGSCTSYTGVDGFVGGNYYKWNATPGTTYLIAVQAYPNSGDYELSITFE